MIRAMSVTVAAGGNKQTPSDTPWKLTVGMIYQVEVAFPPGCSGLVGVQIRDHAGQLYPYEGGEWFVGDSETISFQETHLIEIPPHELILRCYNTDELYPHTVQFRIGLVTRELFIARFLPAVGAEQIAAVLKALTDSAEERRASNTQALLAQGKALLGIEETEAQ
jgi:hypothetical protein